VDEEYVKEQSRKTVANEDAAAPAIKESLNRILGSIPRTASILDVGCRLGCGMRVMKEMGFKEVWGVDINEAYITRLKKEGFNVMWADIELSVPFINDTFDFVWTRHTLEHCRHPEQALKNIRFMMRSGAFVHIIVPIQTELEEYHHVLFKGPADLTEAVEKAGLSVQSLKRINRTKGLNFCDELWCLAMK